MGFNITQIINKFVPTKRVDDDLRENPKGNSYGQEIVSVSEDFYSRLWREGRPLNNTAQGVTLPANTLTSTATVSTSPGCEFYPLSVCVSCDVDAMVMIRYSTKINHVGTSNGQLYDVFYVKAGTPVFREPKGIKIPETGDVSILGLSTTAGKIYGSIYGLEVTADA